MNPDKLAGKQSWTNCNFRFHDQSEESVTGDVNNSHAEIPAKMNTDIRDHVSMV